MVIETHFNWSKNKKFIIPRQFQNYNSYFDTLMDSLVIKTDERKTFIPSSSDDKNCKRKNFNPDSIGNSIGACQRSSVY